MQSGADEGRQEREAIERAADAIVSFFQALPPSAKDEYGALAELDRRFGEDVVAERAARAEAARGRREP